MEARFETFTVLITKINRNIRRIKTEEMAEFDLKSTHVSCLYYLTAMGPLTVKELCEICAEDKANISRSLDDLSQNGYVESNRQKRYRAPFALTEKGQRIGSKIAEKIDRILAVASQGLAEEDRVIFYRSLMLISRNLQNICDQYEAE